MSENKLRNFLRDMKLDEKKAVPDYNKGIRIALSVGRKDIVTKLRRIIKDEKKHSSILKRIKIK